MIPIYRLLHYYKSTSLLGYKYLMLSITNLCSYYKHNINTSIIFINGRKFFYIWIPQIHGDQFQHAISGNLSLEISVLQFSAWYMQSFHAKVCILSAASCVNFSTSAISEALFLSATYVTSPVAIWVQLGCCSSSTTATEPPCTRVTQQLYPTDSIMLVLCLNQQLRAQCCLSVLPPESTGKCTQIPWLACGVPCLFTFPFFKIQQQSDLNEEQESHHHRT